MTSSRIWSVFRVVRVFRGNAESITQNVARESREINANEIRLN